MKKTIYFLLLTFFAIKLSACGGSSSGPSQPNMPADSLMIFREAFDDPETCRGCHPTHYQEWQASMHAYAFVDPVFFKLNDMGQERSNNRLNQECVKCHSPLATLFEEAPPGFEPSQVSRIAQRGVHCDVCHTISKFDRGRSIAHFRLDQVKQGPINEPQENAYHNSEFDARYNKSTICSPCHDVITGNEIQIEFTSTEWDESPYSAMGLECQGCHMPTYSGQAAVDGPVREQVHRHTFVGVDIPLVDFPGRQQTIEMVDELLKHSVTMKVDAPAQISAGDDLNIEVTILNDLTGHNIPSGASFERQMWIELIISDLISGNVIYSSGGLDQNEDLMDHHSEFVKNGLVAEDRDLTLFHGTPFKNGEETLFFWEADSIQDETIPPFESRTATYQLSGPFEANSLQLSVRLRFRSFPPYLLRAIGENQLIDNLTIHDMEVYTREITVQ